MLSKISCLLRVGNCAACIGQDLNGLAICIVSSLMPLIRMSYN